MNASLSSRRIIPALEVFLENISQQNPVGPSLRYDPLYDEVRFARQEDDPRLSMGIWKTDLKRADWSIVESLCMEALTTKSKDLQLAAWLTEAWTFFDGMEGYVRGIRLLDGLSETFWKAIHPQPQEDGDMESRLMIFEWMDEAFSLRLMLIPLTQSKYDETAFGLGFYKSAQHNDASQKRIEKTKAPPRPIDPSKVIGTLDEFQKSLSQTADAYLLKQRQKVGEACQVTQHLKDKLAVLLGASSPSFSQLLGTLKEMERILTAHLQTRAPPLPSLPKAPSEEPILQTVPIAPRERDMPPPFPTTPSSADVFLKEPTPSPLNLKTRDDAYRHLEIIAAFLEGNDPHSLVPQLLHQIIRWKNKNILDLFGEIAKSGQELDILMRLLGSPPSQE